MNTNSQGLKPDSFRAAAEARFLYGFPVQSNPLFSRRLGILSPGCKVTSYAGDGTYWSPDKRRQFVPCNPASMSQGFGATLQSKGAQGVVVALDAGKVKLTYPSGASVTFTASRKGDKFRDSRKPKAWISLTVVKGELSRMLGLPGCRVALRALMVA